MSQQSRKIRRTIKKKFKLCPALLADMRVELAAEEFRPEEFVDFSNRLCRTLADIRVAGATSAQVRALLLHFVERLESGEIS